MISINSVSINLNENEIKQANKDWIFYFYLSSMLILLFLRNAIGVNIPVVFLLLLTIIPSFFGTKDHIVATAVCCIPMSTGFQYKYALFICISAIVIRYRSQIRLSQVAYPVFFMMFWELLHGFTGQFSILEYFRSFAELIFLVTVLSIDLKNINSKFIFRVLAVSTIGICFIMLYLQLQQFGFDFYSVFGRGFRTFRFGQSNTTAENYGLNFNPNRLGSICNLTIGSILLLLGRKEQSALDLVLLALSVIFGFMTLSRTFVVGLVFILLYFILTAKGTIRQKILITISTISITIIPIWLMNEYMPSILHNLIARFQEDNILNNRDDLFLFYNKHILSSIPFFFFGIGLQDFQGKISSIHNVSINVAHNGFQEIWVVWGIVGVVLFIWMLVALIRETKKYEPHPEIRQFLPLGLLFINSMAGQLIRSEIAILSLVIVIVSLCSNNILAQTINENI